MKNYRLLDCGKFEKLEQIGTNIIRRPAPQAIWRRKLDADIWDKYQTRFDLSQNKWIADSEKKLPYFKCNNLTFELKLSPNGQIGIFPEQYTNWQWLESIISQTKRPLNILNGFAYTGASTLFSSSSATTVTHVDASSGSVNWAKKNSSSSHLEGNSIRWIVDDIVTFLTREIKRGRIYDGIILDPPGFGRSKKGAMWKLKRDLPKLMELIDELLSDNPEFVILSCHDKNYGKTELNNELAKLGRLNSSKIETLDLTIKSETGNDLPAGKCARWRR
jgi:23S rRNA (cytosine1962-C5)-methyltransferase